MKKISTLYEALAALVEIAKRREKLREQLDELNKEYNAAEDLAMIGMENLHQEIVVTKQAIFHLAIDTKGDHVLIVCEPTNVEELKSLTFGSGG